MNVKFDLSYLTTLFEVQCPPTVEVPTEYVLAISYHPTPHPLIPTPPPSTPQGDPPRLKWDIPPRLGPRKGGMSPLDPPGQSTP